MTTERRQAPRRKVVDINRMGAWGQVRYVHQLECGHAESRVRAATAPTLACVTCKRVADFDQEIENFQVDTLDSEPDDGHDEVRVEQIAAKLAAKFGIPREAIGLMTSWRSGHLVVTSAHIFLSAVDIRRFTGGSGG